MRIEWPDVAIFALIACLVGGIVWAGCKETEEADRRRQYCVETTQTSIQMLKCLEVMKLQ